MFRDYNSTVNQDIKSKFVEEEVLANVGMMVNYIIQQYNHFEAPFSYDDIENLFIDNTEEIKELEDSLDEEGLSDEDIDLIREQIDELQYEQDEPRDWYESYIVTGWMAKKLSDRGELVIPHMNIWLRQTTGQAIKLDSVISEICEDLEMLEGQRNSEFWINR